MAVLWDWTAQNFFPGVGLINASGSFRGVWFKLDSYQTTVGRRADVHEYPLRNLPNSEDLGRKARRFTFNAYVMGLDWQQTRDQLLNACEADGPGQLVHPFHGEHQVVCESCTVSESRSAGRMFAAFDLTFVEAGSFDAPSYEIDQGFAARDYILGSWPVMRAAFQTGWAVANWPDFVAEDSNAMMGRQVQFQQEAITQGGTTDQVAYGEAYQRTFGGHDANAWSARPPEDVAFDIADLVRSVGVDVLLEDDPAFSMLTEESTWTADLAPVRTLPPPARPPYAYTPSRAQQHKNRIAFAALVHRAAALAFAERVLNVRFDSRARGRVLAADTIVIFDTVIAESSVLNDGTARQLQKVKSITLQLINSRAGLESEDGVFGLISDEGIPSLVAAHFVYREARQVQRLRNANPTAHPNFMESQGLVVPPWP